MIEAIDLSQIVACAPRPEGSWAHLLALVCFVVAAAWLAPGSAAGGVPDSSKLRSSSSRSGT